MKTAIQISTANKIFKREQGKHSEMPCELSINGDRLWFYWAAAKKVIGKTHCCEYEFYPDHYEITRHVYNQFGCTWEQKERRDYK